MGQPVTWQYALVWTPTVEGSLVELYRISSAGHRFLWAKERVPGHEPTVALADVLQQMYNGVLELMERAGTASF